MKLLIHNISFITQNVLLLGKNNQAGGPEMQSILCLLYRQYIILVIVIVLLICLPFAEAEFGKAVFTVWKHCQRDDDVQ